MPFILAFKPGSSTLSLFYPSVFHALAGQLAGHEKAQQPRADHDDGLTANAGGKSRRNAGWKEIEVSEPL